MSGARTARTKEHPARKARRPDRRPRSSAEASRGADRERADATVRRAPHELSSVHGEGVPAGPEAAGAGLEPAPTFALPELPATELSAEERAARQAELAAAEAAIAEATSAGGVVDAFADAPPSVKATAQAGLGARLDGVVQAEEAAFADGVPELHAEMGGTPLGEREGVPPVAAPEVGEVRLEDPPEPDRQPELPPTEAPGRFRANNAVLAFFDRFFDTRGEDGTKRAEAIGKSLSEVKTTDPDIETSPGPKPKVALEGETDPERLETQKQTGREQARGARDDAARGVIEGPGPERAQLLAMDEAVAVGELAKPEVEALQPAPGVARFQALAMPEEVHARFDEDLHASMRDNLAEARGAVETAETERDEKRSAALDEAEAERQAQVEAADAEQRREVLKARRTIQAERQGTLDAQTRAVRDLETEAELESRKQSGAIDKEVEEREKQIGDRYDKEEKAARKKVDKGESDAEAERKKAEEASKKRSWWDRVKGWVKKQFAKLTAAINKIFDAVRSAIKKALDAARSFAKGLIDLAAKFIKKAIAAFGTLLKGLVDTLLADLFPELARKLKEKIDGAVTYLQKRVDEVAADLKAGVDALVDKLQAGLDAILDFFQGALNLAIGLLAAALTGDWGEVARLLLEAALKVVGIAPEDFYAFVGRVLDVLGKIIDAPGTFLGDCVQAVVQGLGGFADNFLQHLKAGVIGWLTGALGDLRIPERFDLAGVLDLTRQVLGLTWEWIRGKAVKLVGEKNVERLELLQDYVDTLREEGWGGLFRRVRDELTGLAGDVLRQISEFLVEQVVRGVAVWIASLFTPVGAVVKLLFTIWNLFLFVRDQLARIIEIIKSLVAAVGQIVNGVVDAAAERIEGALAKALPVAIDLIATLLNVRGVTRRVRGILGAVRRRLDKAVDKLLAGVMKKLKKPKEKKSKDAEVQSALDGGPIVVGRPMTIEVPGDRTYTLFIDVRGEDATVKIKASPPQPLRRFLKSVEKATKAYKKKNPRDEDADEYLATVRHAFDQLKALDTLSDRLAKAERAKAKGKKSKRVDDIPKMRQDILDGEDALRKTLIEIAGSKVLVGEQAVGKDPLQLLFKDEIAGAHEAARIPIRNALLSVAESKPELLRLTWPQIRTKLIDFDEENGIFNKPLRVRSGRFAKVMQDELRKWIKARAGQKEIVDGVELSYPAVEKAIFNLVKNYIARPVNQGVYPRALASVRDAFFHDQDLDVTLRAGLDEAVRQGLKRYQSGDKPEPRLLKALDEAGNVTELLENVATGLVYYDAATREEVSLNTWNSVWSHPGNQKRLKSRFRTVRSKKEHEWIPVEFVGDVIDKAAAEQARGESMLVAVFWVRMQNELRAPTKGLIFDPGTYSRVVKGREPHNDEQSVKVLQGHEGAVYAPLKDTGYTGTKSKPRPKQQTKFSAGWHRHLGTLYTSAEAGTTVDGLTSIWKGVGLWFRDSLWDGESAPSSPLFDEYYSSDRGTPRRIGYEKLRDAYRPQHREAAKAIGHVSHSVVKNLRKPK